MWTFLMVEIEWKLNKEWNLTKCFLVKQIVSMNKIPRKTKAKLWVKYLCEFIVYLKWKWVITIIQ